MAQLNQPQNWQGRRVHLGRVSRGSLQTTTVGRVLGTGGEGTVYADATRPDFVLKIMHNPTPTSDAKTQAMLASPPSAQVGTYQGVDLVQIAWPQERVTDDSGSYLGFSMRFLDVAKTIGLGAWTNLRERRLNNLSLDDRLRVHLAANLASVTDYISDAGHALVDLKPLNVLAYRADGYVCLVDCDGFRIQHAGSVFPASAYTPDFLAPEYHGYTVSASQLGEEQDRFALAIVIFQLLDNGIHPFAGNDGQSFVLHDRIMRQRTFIDANSGLTPPSSSHAAFFADDTLDLFLRAFAGPADQRPSAADWRRHLQDLAQRGLHMCGGDPDHWHYGKGCPWCAQAMQLAPPPYARVRANSSPTYAAAAPAPAPPFAAPVVAATAAAPWSPASAAATALGSPAAANAAVPAARSSVVGMARDNWKKTAAAVAFLVLIGSGVWAVTRPTVDLFASRRARLEQIVTQATGLTDRLATLRRNSKESEVAPLVKMAGDVNGAIQSARSAIDNQDTTQADLQLTRADGAITTFSSALVAYANRPVPPIPPSPPPFGDTSTTPDAPPMNPENAGRDPETRGPFGGDGGTIKPESPLPEKENPGFGDLIGDGGFIKPLPEKAADPQDGSEASARRPPPPVQNPMDLLIGGAPGYIRPDRTKGPEGYRPAGVSIVIVQRFESLQRRAEGARNTIALLRSRGSARSDLNALALRLQSGLSDASTAIQSGRENDAKRALDSVEATLVIIQP
jgi:serine/threonine protein kinase